MWRFWTSKQGKWHQTRVKNKFLCLFLLASLQKRRDCRWKLWKEQIAWKLHPKNNFDISFGVLCFKTFTKENEKESREHELWWQINYSSTASNRLSFYSSKKKSLDKRNLQTIFNSFFLFVIRQENHYLNLLL